MKKFLCFLLLLASSLAFYSNQEASKCLSTKAYPKCSSAISQCIEDNQSCQEELAQFQSCTFGTPSAIFNGVCFRQWKESAKLTADMIECMSTECDLLYNSGFGIKQSAQCLSNIMKVKQNNQKCDRKCFDELRNLRQLLNEEKIEDLITMSKEN